MKAPLRHGGIPSKITSRQHIEQPPGHSIRGSIGNKDAPAAVHHNSRGIAQPPRHEFKIRPAGEDFTLDRQPRAEGVFDMFGAPLDGRTPRKLDIAPTWYVGLDKGCDWFKQTPIDVESNHFVRNVAGPVRLSLVPNR